MSLEANDLLLFARVADEGSFSRAAERLGLPKSTVSRRITAMEATLGERLLLRTTRKLAVTDFGRSVLDHAHHVVEEVEAATSLALQRKSQPSGRLRVSMPADLAGLVFGDIFADLIARYPAIDVELDLTPRRVDLIGENFDVAIRMGNLPDDASLAARRIATWSSGLFAAPSYIERHGQPPEPEALMEHDTLRLLARNGEPLPWILTRGEQRWEGLPPGRATANSPDFLMKLARAGAGITVAQHHFAESYVRGGELVPVLPAWHCPSSDAWAVFPGRRLMPARTRVFLDIIAAKFAGPECQVVEARAKETMAKAVARL